MRLEARHCKVCDAKFIPNCGKQIYCSYCAPLVRRHSHNKNRVQVVREELLAKQRPRDHAAADGCDGCRYWRKVGVDLRACHYMLDTSTSRPCPAGAGCLVRSESTTKERQQ